MDWTMPQQLRGFTKIRSLENVTRLFVLLICAAIIGLSAWRIHLAREVELRDSRVITTNLARSLADHAQSTIEAADILITGIVERLESDGHTDTALARLRTVLAAKVGMVSRVRDIFVFDPDGRMLTSSLPHDPPGTANDREYFAWHHANADRGPHFSPPIQGRHNGRWTLTMSRRVDASDGSLAAIVVATIDFATFTQFYASFDIGPQGTILLVNDDGTLLVRVPERQGTIGTNLKDGPGFQAYRRIGPVGSSSGIAKVDGIVRYNSFRKVGGYPFVVIVALSEADILAQWREDSIVAIIASGVVAFIIGSVGFRLIAVRKRGDDLLHKAINQLQQMAMLDGLTGIANRRCFDLIFKKEQRRAARSRKPLAILLIDVDHFKAYNDRNGHPAGDACLCSIAQIIGGQMRRPADLAARYGGEEFIVMLPETEADGALVTAENIRAALRNAAIPHHASLSHIVTVSIGAAVAGPGDQAQPAQYLIERADAALYTAKRNGRDQVQLAPKPNSESADPL